MLYLSSDWFLVFLDQAKPKYLIYFFLDKKSLPSALFQSAETAKKPGSQTW